MASTIENPSLKLQFEQLQKQQQERLQRRKQTHNEKQQQPTQSNNSAAPSFGINDDLQLKVPGSQPNLQAAVVAEEKLSDIQNDVRELKDENGRLYKLLSEKDFELRKYKKKMAAFETGETSGLTNETAATKIVELSKKIREMTSALEVERTKGKQLTKRCLELDKELQAVKKNGPSVPESAKPSKGSSSARSLETDLYGIVQPPPPPENEVKELHDKLRQAELKVSEYRNQTQLLKKDLSMAQKVIEQEVGDGANVQQLMNTTSGWRGRAQQVIALQKKVNELKAQLENNPDMSSQYSDDLDVESMKPVKRSAVAKHMEQLKKMEKDKKEVLEKSARELKALEADYELLKAKTEGLKARNKSLSDDNKRIKSEIQEIINKSDLDDQLVQRLTKELQQARTDYQEERNRCSEMKGRLEQANQQETVRSQQEGNIVTQLQRIINDKDSQIKRLEESLGYSFHSSRPTSVNDIQVTATVLDNRTISTPVSHRLEIQRPESGRFSRQHTTHAADVVLLKEELSEVHAQCQEYKTLCQAATVEKEKQAELVAVLQARIAEATARVQEAQNEVAVLQRHNVDLEKKLARATMQEKGQSAATKRNQSKANLSARPDEASVSVTELQSQFDIQKDENQALKVSMRKTLEMKEEELRIYREMLEQTKTIFLQGLRQYRHTQS